MGSPERGGWRLARAAALAGCVLALAVAAHLAGGGALPGPFALGALGVLVGCATFALAGRTLSRSGALAVLGTGQVLLHAALVQAAAPGAAVLPAGHHGVLLTGAPGVPGPSAPGTAAAHAVATLACALLLAAGDRALALLLAWLRPVHRPAVAVLTVVLRAHVPPAPRAVLPCALAVPARWTTRRGPPRGPAPATTA